MRDWREHGAELFFARRIFFPWIYSAQNRSNFDAHFEGTGPEIWRQTNGRVDAFVAGAGELHFILSVSFSFHTAGIQLGGHNFGHPVDDHSGS